MKYPHFSICPQKAIKPSYLTRTSRYLSALRPVKLVVHNENLKRAPDRANVLVLVKIEKVLKIL